MRGILNAKTVQLVNAPTHIALLAIMSLGYLGCISPLNRLLLQVCFGDTDKTEYLNNGEKQEAHGPLCPACPFCQISPC